MGITASGGYFHGYLNGTEYPFYFNGYTKTQTYTQAEVNSLINALKNRVSVLENSSGNSSEADLVHPQILKFDAYSTNNTGRFVTESFTVPKNGYFFQDVKLLYSGHHDGGIGDYDITINGKTIPSGYLFAVKKGTVINFKVWLITSYAPTGIKYTVQWGIFYPNK